MQQALDLTPKPHLEVVQQLGRNCHMPNACQTPLHVVLHHEWLSQLPQGEGGAAALATGDLTTSSNGDCKTLEGGSGVQGVFVGALRDALRAGGCCASRAGFAGALLGALLGPDCLPQSWAGKCSSYAEVKDAAEVLCSLRTR
jgi:hypothetical protein